MPYYFEQKFCEDRRVFISQNGIDWVDLPAFPAEKAGSAAKITTWLTGDLSFMSPVAEEPPPAPPVPEGEPPADPPEPIIVEVTEMERISWMFDEITTSTRIVPKGYFIVNAANELVANKGYSGLPFPVRTKRARIFRVNKNPCMLLLRSCAAGSASTLIGRKVVNPDELKPLV